MSITSELRAWAKEHLGRNSILAIADRIDAEHESAVYNMRREFEEWEHTQDMCYVKLPVDADGVPIRVGDVMESGDGDVFTVSSVDYGLHPSNGRGKFWMLWNEDADFYECAYECRHHKQPTVEDVLREMCLEIDRRCERGSIDYDELFAEYAAKLRLAKEGE